LASVDLDQTSAAPVDADQREVLARYVDAFERYDIERIVALLRDDVAFSMPPFDLWLRGPVEVGRWLVGQGAGCAGSRLLATSANGCAAFGSYKPAGPGRWEPFALQVLEVTDGVVVGWHNFLYPELFAAFGLPSHLED